MRITAVSVVALSLLALTACSPSAPTASTSPAQTTAEIPVPSPSTEGEVSPDSSPSPTLSAEESSALGSSSTAMAEASPDQEATSKSIGIGVSRTSVQSAFEQPEVGFRFEPRSSGDGNPRVVGESPDGLVSLELVGSPEDLVRTTISVEIPSDNDTARDKNGSYAVRLIETAAPEWTNGSSWLAEQLEAIENGAPPIVSTTFGDNKVELNVARDIEVYALTIKPN